MSVNNLPKISESELEVLQLIWEYSEPMTVTQIRTEMTERTDWEPATVKTLLSRLHKKGAVERVYSDEKKVYLYSPLVSKEDYSRKSASNLIGKLFDGNAKKLVASLIQSDRLTKEDIAELYEKWGSDEN